VIAIAITQLRHSDSKERAKGRSTLASFASRQPAWRGANALASPTERAAFGEWLWTIGARREAYDHLDAWHAATKAPRDALLQAAYLRALAWWSPVWLGRVKPPPAEDLVGPERCWFPGTDCTPPVADDPPLPAAPPVDADPRAAVAARYAIARTGVRSNATAATDPTAATEFAGVTVTALSQIATAFARDPAIAERLGRDFVASATDAALAHAMLGALFDALGDPARARAAWHAAVDASPEPAFMRGLAETTARAGDGSAALVFATHAAAASGDPAVVWAAIARALVRSGQHVEALTAARSAIDLAGPEVLPHALDVAVAASRALGRAAQADALTMQRARLDRTATTPAAPDAPPAPATEAQAALAAHREEPTASTIARLWVASRAAPRDIELRAALLDALEPDDPRHATITTELISLAGDPDPDRAFAAVTALRR
jgi:tetratricopeptide (TPR) repeat protein